MTNKKDLGQCEEQVSDNAPWPRFHQCTKKAVVIRSHRPGTSYSCDKAYCKIHDPEYIEAKRKAQDAKWEKEWATKRAKSKLEATAVEACKKINTDNPQAAAEALTDLYEACNTFQAALTIWLIDPSKAPNTLTTIFKETIGKVIAKAESKKGEGYANHKSSNHSHR